MLEALLLAAFESAAITVHLKVTLGESGVGWDRAFLATMSMSFIMLIHTLFTFNFKVKNFRLILKF